MYTYCNNGSVNFSDPSGTWKQAVGGWQAQKGDTLWGLATVLYGNGSQWKSFAFGRDPKTLQVGEIIKTGNVGSISNGGESGGITLLPLRDVTSEVNRALKIYALSAREIARLADAFPFYNIYRYAAFGLLVNHGGAWDIKRKESWEKTIGTAFPGSYNTLVLYSGMLMTPESLGNFTYGCLGASFGIPYQTLIYGSVGAALITGGFNTYDGAVNEFGDWNYVATGYLSWFI